MSFELVEIDDEGEEEATQSGFDRVVEANPFTITPSAPVNVLDITQQRARTVAPTGVGVSSRLPWGASLISAIAGDKYKSRYKEGFNQSLSTRQALVEGGLDFNVTLEELTTKEVMTDIGVGPLEIPDRYAVVGSHGKVLGLVSDIYKPLQPQRQAEFTDLLTATDQAGLVGAGITKEGGFGSRLYTVVELHEDFYPPGMPDENVKVHVLTTNSFDGGTSFRCSIVPTREVCVNTMRVVYHKGVLSWSVRHSSEMEANMVKAREAIQVAAEWGQNMVIDAQQLLAVPMLVDAANEVFEEMIPVPDPIRVDDEVANQRTIDRRIKARDECFRMWRHSPNLEDVRGTAWGVLQGWGEWTQHGKRHRTPAMDRLVRDVHQGNGADTSMTKVRELLLART